MTSPSKCLMLLITVASIAFVALVSAAAGASIAPKGGKVYACYRVSGKVKGGLRVVAKKQHCKHGERKLTWSTAASSLPGPAGAQGAQGPAGARGESGLRGASGAAADLTEVALLKSEVESLNLQLSQLDGVLAGVTHAQLSDAVGSLPGLKTTVSGLSTDVGGLEDTLAGIGNTELTGALGKLSGVSGAQLSQAVQALPSAAALSPKLANVEELLKGVTNTQLTEAVKAAPAVATLCTQASTLTSQSNLLGSSLSSIKVIGGLFELELPKVAALKPFSC